MRRPTRIALHRGACPARRPHVFVDDVGQIWRHYWVRFEARCYRCKGVGDTVKDCFYFTVAAPGWSTGVATPFRRCWPCTRELYQENYVRPLTEREYSAFLLGEPVTPARAETCEGHRPEAEPEGRP